MVARTAHQEKVIAGALASHDFRVRPTRRAFGCCCWVVGKDKNACIGVMRPDLLHGPIIIIPAEHTMNGGRAWIGRIIAPAQMKRDAVLAIQRISQGQSARPREFLRRKGRCNEPGILGEIARRLKIPRDHHTIRQLLERRVDMKMRLAIEPPRESGRTIFAAGDALECSPDFGRYARLLRQGFGFEPKGRQRIGAQTLCAKA